MKKVFVACILAALTIGMVGCQKGQTATTTDQADSAQQPAQNGDMTTSS